MSIPPECGSFKVLRLKFKESLPTEHYVFAKEHSVREKCPEKPSDKTVFIVGVPPFVTDDMFKEMFSQFGNVKSVFFHSTPDPGIPPQNKSSFFSDVPVIKGYKVCYIVFEKSSSVDKLMAIDSDEKLILLNEETPIPFGLPKWCSDYNKMLLDPTEIQVEIDEYMEEYDRKVEEEDRRIKELTDQPDEEGWLTVTKKSRKPAIARKESVHKKVMKKLAIKNKKKQLLNFYRFQIRENKMNQLVQLREKFEEDKKKIEQMKQARKFKPF